MRRLFARVAFLAGLSVWFPAFAPVVVGDTTGVQLALPLFLALLVLGFLCGNGRVSSHALIVLLVWSMGIVVSSAFSPDFAQSLRGIIIFASGFMVLLASSYIASSPGALSAFIDAFIWGGVISSLYAVYQLFAFRFSFPQSTLFNNNPAFPTYADDAYLSTLSRTFAFTPEPSVFASLLIPALFFILYRIVVQQKGSTTTTVQLAMVVLGLVVSSSLGAFTSLPIALFLVMVLVKEVRERRSRLFVYAVVATFIGSMFLTVPYFQEIFSETFARALNLSEDESAQIRATSMKTALDIFVEHPVTGYGVSTSAEEFAERTTTITPYGTLQAKTGVDSWPLNIAAEQGIAGLIGFGMAAYLAVANSRGRPEIGVVVIALLVVISLQTGYVMLYHVWALLGLGIGSAVRPPQPVTARSTEVTSRVLDAAHRRS